MWLAIQVLTEIGMSFATSAKQMNLGRRFSADNDTDAFYALYSLGNTRRALLEKMTVEPSYRATTSGPARRKHPTDR